MSQKPQESVPDVHHMAYAADPGVASGLDGQRYVAEINRQIQRQHANSGHYHKEISSTSMDNFLDHECNCARTFYLCCLENECRQRVSQLPSSVTIIITTTTICHYHHHNHLSL